MNTLETSSNKFIYWNLKRDTCIVTENGSADSYRRNKPSDNIETDKAAAPLKDTFRNLKYKYVEMQDEYKREIEALKDKIEGLKKESEIQALKLDRANTVIDESKGEILKMRGKGNGMVRI